MKNKQISLFDFLCETHAGLKRQGPGSSEMTLKALSFIENLDKNSQVADLGCGTGGQTMLLAQNIQGNIVGLDFMPDFINAFNNDAEKQSLSDRVKGITGSMDNLPFEQRSFDLIWSEGAIDNIGFKNGLEYWNIFLKTGGYIAVTCPSWFTEIQPDEVKKFWNDAGSELDTIAHNVDIMQKSGYSFCAAFALPENCWTDNYYIPRTIAETEMLKKYTGNKSVEEFIARNKAEVSLYEKYKEYYGYAFYIGKKLSNSN